jgi:hypothetical protein
MCTSDFNLFFKDIYSPEDSFSFFRQNQQSITGFLNDVFNGLRSREEKQTDTIFLKCTNGYENITYLKMKFNHHSI